MNFIELFCFGGGWTIRNFSIISVHFVFRLLNFIVLFLYLIKVCNISFFIIIIIIIIFWFGCDRPSGLFFYFSACFAFFYTPTSLIPSSSIFFILFRSCSSHAWVFEKTLVHSSYSHTEWYLLFLTVQLQVRIVYSERNTRNS